MNVLIACEESGRVCAAFRARGFNAFSCDIQETSGNLPQYHLNEDVTRIIKTPVSFVTQNASEYYIDKWDLIIAHPPCTHLAVTGMRWFKEGRKPRYLIDEAAEFFMKFVNADCEHIAIENPVCVMSTRYRKPDQIINPFQFGHPEQKKTCLW